MYPGKDLAHGITGANAKQLDPYEYSQVCYWTVCQDTSPWCDCTSRVCDFWKLAEIARDCEWTDGEWKVGRTHRNKNGRIYSNNQRMLPRGNCSILFTGLFHYSTWKGTCLALMTRLMITTVSKSLEQLEVVQLERLFLAKRLAILESLHPPQDRMKLLLMEELVLRKQLQYRVYNVKICYSFVYRRILLIKNSKGSRATNSSLPKILLFLVSRANHWDKPILLLW